jgi:CO/xanthine dehydrogenase Mo-binding subunit
MLAGHVAFAAKKTGRPVALILERAEDISVTTKRHPSRIKLKTAVDVSGRITALQADIVLDGGAYAGLSAVVLQRAMFAAAGVYRIPNTLINGIAYATNHVPSGAYRGFGAPQAIFAIEMHMQRLARLLGEDPVAYKKRHFVVKNDETVTSGVFHHKVPLPEIAERLDELFIHNPVRHRDDGRKRGIGYSFFLHGCGFTGSGERDIIKARLKLTRGEDGVVTILAASVDMGQGAATTLRKIAAETLEIPLEKVVYNHPDTAVVPDSGPTVASRTAMIVGGLVKRAAEKLKEKWNEKGNIEAEVRYRQPEGIEWDQQKLLGDAYPDYSWGGIAVEVAVDKDTLETEVLGVWSVFDVGEVLDENILVGQVHGGIAQGIGWASLEVMRSNNGKLSQGNMTDYVIPASLDLPAMVNDFINIPYPEGPFGAKGAGELTFVGAAPAYLAAVENALNISLNDIPAAPEYLFEEINHGK